MTLFLLSEGTSPCEHPPCTTLCHTMGLMGRDSLWQRAGFQTQPERMHSGARRSVRCGEIPQHNNKARGSGMSDHCWESSRHLLLSIHNHPHDGTKPSGAGDLWQLHLQLRLAHTHTHGCAGCLGHKKSKHHKAVSLRAIEQLYQPGPLCPGPGAALQCPRCCSIKSLCKGRAVPGSVNRT